MSEKVLDREMISWGTVESHVGCDFSSWVFSIRLLHEKCSRDRVLLIVRVFDCQTYVHT